MKSVFKTTALAVLVSVGVTACGSSGKANSTSSNFPPISSGDTKSKQEQAPRNTENQNNNRKAKEAPAPGTQEGNTPRNKENTPPRVQEDGKKPQNDTTPRSNEDADRRAKEDADRKAKEDADRRAKEDAERRAKEDADRRAKEDADRRAKEDAERRAREERLRYKPDDFKYVKTELSNSPHAFLPLVEKELESALVSETPGGIVYEEHWKPKQIHRIIVGGQNITIDAKYDLLHYKLSDAAIARINAFGEVNNNDVGLATLYLYGGNATNANELDKLSGTFAYKGEAILDSGTTNIELNADFSKKTLSGKIGYQYGINLDETAIKTDSGYLTFKGTAKGFGDELDFKNYSGSYEGKFMGSQAKQVAGVVSLQHNFIQPSKRGAVFIGEKK